MCNSLKTAATLSLLLLCGAPGLQAQDGARVVVRAGTLLDGTGGSRNNVDIVINGRRIDAMRPAGSSAPTYDLSRYTVLPGGIDTHVHINWHFDPDGKTHHLSGDEESREQAVQYAIDNAGATLQSGITTV